MDISDLESRLSGHEGEIVCLVIDQPKTGSHDACVIVDFMPRANSPSVDSYYIYRGRIGIYKGINRNYSSVFGPSVELYHHLLYYYPRNPESVFWLGGRLSGSAGFRISILSLDYCPASVVINVYIGQNAVAEYLERIGLTRPAELVRQYRSWSQMPQLLVAGK